MKPGYQRDTCTPTFIAALFTVAEMWKELKCLSVNVWIKKCAVCVLEYYATMRKKELLTSASKMDGP